MRTPPGCLRIAFSAETPDGHPIDPEVKDALARVAKWLEDLGHHVEERGLDVDYRRLYKAQRAVSTANFAAEMAELIREAGREPRPDELEPNTWAVLLSGRRRSGEEVMAAWRTLRVMCRQILQRFETFDVFLTPMRGTALPRIGDLGPEQDPRELNRKQARALPFTPPFNLTGQPAISLPLVHTADGLPLGMQLVGRYADEATLFRLAAQLEQAHPWRSRKPRLWG
ncbi:MAG: amidase [Deltaproteobacteria bacterium]|nr:MAG: amidase [Deltaproteobacteria bacterium]